jgi:hybrid cluster-associated redox disulfide protein
MSNTELIHPQVTVDDLLSRYPQTARYFIVQGMACIGCVISRFHTLAEIADVYQVDIEILVSDLHNTLTERDAE